MEKPTHTASKFPATLTQGEFRRGKTSTGPRKRSSADEEARRIVRAEMARRDFSYKQLVVAMERLGHKKVTEGNLISRISRGSFTFGFAIEILRAMGATEIDISPVNVHGSPNAHTEREKGR